MDNKKYIKKIWFYRQSPKLLTGRFFSAKLWILSIFSQGKALEQLAI